MAKRLASRVDLPLVLNPNVGRKPPAQKVESVPPEVGVMAMIIIALKLVYGLAGREEVCVPAL